jgi:hypothetical protein
MILHPRSVFEREENAEYRALGHAIALDNAAVITDNLGDKGKTEAGAGTLRGNERIE